VGIRSIGVVIMSTVLYYEQRHLRAGPTAVDISGIIMERLGIRPSGISDSIDGIAFIFSYHLEDDEIFVINGIMDDFGFDSV